MNIDEFYAEDERRRSSDEMAFGLEWRLDADPLAHYGVHWIADTGEVYVMREPETPFVYTRNPEPRLGAVDDAAYDVAVLGWAGSVEELTSAIEGWELRMTEPNSLDWLQDQLGRLER